jgi:hypothetical protein
VSISAPRVRVGGDRSESIQKRDCAIKQYLLSIYQPEGDPPPAEVLEKIARDVLAVQEEMRAAREWVFSGGLHPASTATVLDPLALLRHL